MRHRLPVPAHPTCVLIASLSGLPKLSESARVRSPQIRSSSRSSGTPRGLLAAACVCARVGARARACEQACVFVHERARANTQPRTDQDPRFRRQVYDKQKGKQRLEDIHCTTEDPGTSGLVCVRARVRVCVHKAPGKHGWMDARCQTRMYERPCFTVTWAR